MSMSANLHIRADASPAIARRIDASEWGAPFTTLIFHAQASSYPEVALIYPAETPHELIAAVAAAHNAALAASRGPPCQPAGASCAPVPAD